MTASCLRGRRTYAPLLAALVPLVSMLVGCGDVSDARSEPQGGAAQDKNTAAESAEPIDIARLIEAWALVSGREREDDGKTPETIVSLFVDLGENAELGELRVFELDEAEFVRLTPDQRAALGSAYIFRSGHLKSLCRAALDAAESLREEGQEAEAERYLQAVRRCAEANLQEGIVEIGRMAAEAIRDAAEEAMKALDREAAGHPDAGG